MKIDFKSEKETKVLTWIGMDFSEDDGVMQKFSCRFKTEETAAEFKVEKLTNCRYITVSICKQIK